MGLDYLPGGDDSTRRGKGPGRAGGPIAAPGAGKTDLPAEWDDGARITAQQIDYCMECGVCTGSCPISRESPDFSPRLMVKRALLDEGAEVSSGPEIWLCLSCARCRERCPAEIDIPEFNRQSRLKARESGRGPGESHHGIVQTLTRIQTRDLEQHRTAWAEEAGTFRDHGNYYYYTGCLPYFDILFRHIGVLPLDTARGVLTLLNAVGVEPVISDRERCCGHDALWTGDEDTFAELARRNIEAIESSGAKTVLFSCPECYFSFKQHYPRRFGALPFEVVHLSEFLADRMAESGLSFRADGDLPVTFHDPCRLGRWSGLYEPPRQLLGAVAGGELTEMERNRENASCCGTSAWIECSGLSAAIQVERLEEAQRTGAGTLVTACPKCQIHLTCARNGTDMDIRVTDLFTYLSDGMKRARARD